MVLLLSLKISCDQKKIFTTETPLTFFFTQELFLGGSGSYVFCKQKEHKYSCLFPFYHFKTWKLAIFHHAKEHMGNWKWIISPKFEDE